MCEITLGKSVFCFYFVNLMAEDGDCWKEMEQKEDVPGQATACPGTSSYLRDYLEDYAVSTAGPPEDAPSLWLEAADSSA